MWKMVVLAGLTIAGAITVAAQTAAKGVVFRDGSTGRTASTRR
jgi:hypothetical protein